MKLKPIVIMMAAGMIACLLLASASPAAEILTEQDFKQYIVTSTHLIKTADNGIILFDASSSMKQPFLKTGRSTYEVAVDQLRTAAKNFPEMGHNIGLYLYNRWKPVYPVQRFNRQKFAAALDTLPAEPKGPTLLMQGLIKLEPVLQQLTGRTVVFIYTDGTISTSAGQKAPRIKAREMAQKYNVCFYLISSASTAANRKMLKDVAGINACSRVIPIEAYLGNPEYNAGALFVVKSSESLVTVSDQKVVGLKVNDIRFGFNSADVQPQFIQSLKKIGQFMEEHTDAYILLEGYTDSVGGMEYNLALSRLRAESVAFYLMNNFLIDSSRIVYNWYGYNDPVASNSTSEGRAQNRRVEIAVGGL